MLVHRDRLRRSPFFHFHSGHSLYSLLVAAILFAMLVWMFLITPIGAR